MSRSPGVFLVFSSRVADASGRPASFIAALSLILLWAGSGPFFHFSETWQMVVNTGTTIITFLMVFLLQYAQNRDNRALHAKLDELILTGASDNRFVGVENLDADELRRVSVELVEKAGTSIDESPVDEISHVEVHVNDERIVNLELQNGE
ncbi:MAG: low affinity iron permease family protein [bacterium]